MMKGEGEAEGGGGWGPGGYGQGFGGPMGGMAVGPMGGMMGGPPPGHLGHPPPVPGQPPYGQPPGGALVPALDPHDVNRIAELRNELDRLDPNLYKNSHKLLLAEIERMENRMDPEYLEVDIPKPIKVIRKILVPSHRHPKFNFVGKVLGPGGKTLQAMAKQFKCHIYILGRGSTKDRAKEEEQLNSGEAKHAHFALPLHVRIETEAPAPLAYGRVSAVIAQMEKVLQPVRDELVASQMEELGYEFLPGAPGPRGPRPPGPPPMRGFPPRGGPMRGRGRPPAPRGRAAFQNRAAPY